MGGTPGSRCIGAEVSGLKASKESTLTDREQDAV
jgi:hypothetical protein